MRDKKRRSGIESRLINGIVVFCIIIMPCIVNASEDFKHTVGLGIFAGKKISDGMVWHVTDDLEWNYTAIHPSYGWLLGERWQVDLEGTLGIYNFRNGENIKEDTYSLGISLMAGYDFLKHEKFSLYFDVGLGVGYWNFTPDNSVVDSHSVIGLIQYGAGIKIPVRKNYFIKTAYRVNHGSGIFSKDSGCNTHGIFIGIVKKF